MRHFFFTILIACSLVLSACNSKDEKATSTAGAAAAGVTIWWAKWAPADGLQQLADEYTKDTGIPVKVRQIDWGSYQNQVFLDFGSKTTTFDIVVGDSQWIGKGATNKLYVDLTDWLKGAVDLNTVNPLALKYICQYPTGSGKYFAAPCEVDATGFAYRKDWFEDPKEKDAFKAKYNRELAPPKNWDEFTQVAEFFTRPDEKKYGCSILTDRNYDELVMGWQQVMWAYGGSWGNSSTYKVEGVLNSPESVAALDFYKSLIKFAPSGGSMSGYGKNVEVFTNGSVAMTMNYFAFFPGVAAKMPKEAGFFVMPAKGTNRAVSLGGQGMSISNKVSPARQEEAKKFIAWFLKKEQQEKWIKKEAGFTANSDILKSDAFRKATPYNAAFADSLESVQDFWNVPVYNELLSAAQQHLGDALDGKASSKDALDALAKEHQSILDNAGLGK